MSKESTDALTQTERMAEARREEEKLGVHAWVRWTERRRRIVALAGLLRGVDPVALWENVDQDDLAQVYEEVLTMHQLAGRVLANLDWVKQQRDDRDEDVDEEYDPFADEEED